MAEIGDHLKDDYESRNEMQPDKKRPAMPKATLQPLSFAKY